MSDMVHTVTRDSVTTRIIGTLARMLDREPASLQLTDRFFEDLSFDSTSILEVLMYLEDELGVEFDQSTPEPADFQTVGTLIDYVVKHLGA